MKNNIKRGINSDDRINSKNKKNSKETKNFNFENLNFFINSKIQKKSKKPKELSNNNIISTKKQNSYFIINGFKPQKSSDKDYIKFKYLSLQDNPKNLNIGSLDKIDEKSNSSSSSYEKLSKVFGFDSSLSKTAKISDFLLSESFDDPELEKSIVSIEKKNLEFLKEEENYNELKKKKLEKSLKNKKLKKTSFFSTQESKKHINLKDIKKKKSKLKSFTNKLKNTGKSYYPKPAQNPEQKKAPQKTGRKNYMRIKDQSKFEIKTEKIKEIGKTTLMIKNIPNKYTKEQMLESINKKFTNTFDFFYLPIDFNNHCNLGYAFINFKNCIFIKKFYLEFNNKKWEFFNSEKICRINYARIQGKKECQEHFQDSSLMKQRDSDLKPSFIDSSCLKNVNRLVGYQKNKI